MKNFDSTDLRLLALLQQDASISNQALAERVGVSPATCLRRVQRLESRGVIERRVAILNPQALADETARAPLLTCIAEVNLDRQSAEELDRFEATAVAFAEVQQCWRVSSGPDFVLVIQVPEMEAYQALTRQLFAQNTNVRNVKVFFATRRAKFSTALLLPQSFDGAASN